MKSLLDDLAYGLRLLIRNYGFSSLAILIMALGIGATSAIFSVTNAILLRPLPYAHPERIVMIWGVNPQLDIGLFKFPSSPGQFTDYLNQSNVFDHLVAFNSHAINLEGMGEPEKLGDTLVTADFFATLGATPRLGRGFLLEEYQPGHNRVVILSHNLWQRRFGSDPAIINRAIKLSGNSYTVIGVMPPDFRYPRGVDLPIVLQFPAQTDIWSPLVFTADQLNDRWSWDYPTIARLKPGVTLETAQLQLSAIARRNQEHYPQSDAGFSVTVIPMKEQIVGSYRQVFLILLSVSGFVLLIACTNVASLLLVRAVKRQREIAIRSALGASSFRIVRHLLIESVLLSLSGGVIGLIPSFYVMNLLIKLAPDNIPGIRDVSIDLHVVAFTFVLALLTGVIFGLVPALSASKPDLNRALKEGGERMISPHSRIQKALVVTEVALAIVLLSGAGLMIRSFARLSQVDSGLDPTNVLTMQLSISHERYPKEEQRLAFYDRVAARLRALPGVTSVAYTSTIPLSGGGIKGTVLIEHQPVPESLEKWPIVRSEAVTIDYFRTLGIPLLKGREFTEYDKQDAPGVVIVNDAFVRRFFPGEDPIGKRFKIGDDGAWQSIVGVVRGVRAAALDTEPELEVYIPFVQRPDWDLALLLRTKSDPRMIAAAAQKEIRTEDKEIPVFHVETMNQIISESISQRRFNVLLMSLFATVALLLAAAGIYGVMSYLVTQRTQEIGVRMALGAQRSDIVKLIISQGLILVFIGLVIGLVTSLVLTRVIKILLFGISATDPLTMLMVSVLLVAVALISNLIPVLRATRIDPLIALRYE